MKLKMSLFSLLGDIGPFFMLPYTVLLVFIIAYLVYRKYTVCQAIRNVPAYTILDIDLSKVKLNLKIESMVYNFLLILSGLELLSDLLGGITTIVLDWYNAFIYNATEQSIQTPLDKAVRVTTNATNSLCMIVLTLLPSTGSLFLIVLRRAYLNLPYTPWIRGYTANILARFIIPSCRSFYLLLLGRSVEARWHSSLSEYRTKRNIAKQFFYAQILTLVFFSLVLIDFLTVFILSPMVILLNQPLLFNTLSLGLFPHITLSSGSRSHMVSAFDIISLGQTIVLVFLVLVLSLTYILVSIGVIIKLIRRQKKYNHINEWVTKPLMEEYRNTIDSARYNVQRPPFIQAFRTEPEF